MYQRHMCPTAGALRRTLAADVSAAASRHPSRAFSVSVRRCDDANADTPAPAALPANRKARAANALNQIARLGANRRSGVGGLAKGSFPSGQRADGLKITRELVGPRTGASPTSSSPPPPGAMARAPARLKLSRPPTTGPRRSAQPGANASIGGARRGPNLRGRDAKGSSPRGGSNSGEQRPKMRERRGADADGGSESMEVADVPIEKVLPDTMVQHLLRLQRAEWDRKPYEPKYAPGSFAANQLIHAGRELCRGEAPPVKIWGPLEKTIGVVGMHGAEAHLKVRRVVYDDEKLGERRHYFETGDVDMKPKKASKQTAAAV